MTTCRSGLLPHIILPDVIFENFKGPCGHDNPSFGAFPPNHFCRMSFLRNSKAPAGMTTRRSGLLPHLLLPDVIFEKFKGPCGHDSPSFGAFAPIHFCRMSFLRNLKAPAGMTTRRSGLLPKSFFRMTFLRNSKAPAGMTTRGSGLLPQMIFANACGLACRSRVMFFFDFLKDLSSITPTFLMKFGLEPR